MKKNTKKYLWTIIALLLMMIFTGVIYAQQRKIDALNEKNNDIDQIVKKKQSPKKGETGTETRKLKEENKHLNEIKQIVIEWFKENEFDKAGLLDLADKIGVQPSSEKFRNIILKRKKPNKIMRRYSKIESIFGKKLPVNKALGNKPKAKSIGEMEEKNEPESAPRAKTAGQLAEMNPKQFKEEGSKKKTESESIDAPVGNSTENGSLEWDSVHDLDVEEDDPIELLSVLFEKYTIMDKGDPTRDALDTQIHNYIEIVKRTVDEAYLTISSTENEITDLKTEMYTVELSLKALKEENEILNGEKEDLVVQIEEINKKNEELKKKIKKATKKSYEESSGSVEEEEEAVSEKKSKSPVPRKFMRTVAVSTEDILEGEEEEVRRKEKKGRTSRGSPKKEAEIDDLLENLELQLSDLHIKHKMLKARMVEVTQKNFELEAYISHYDEEYGKAATKNIQLKREKDFLIDRIKMYEALEEEKRNLPKGETGVIEEEGGETVFYNPESEKED